jgi:hypothetical protein
MRVLLRRLVMFCLGDWGGCADVLMFWVGFSLVSLFRRQGMGEHARLIESRFATEEALREIRRVLRPGGALGVIWNIEDCEPHFLPS